MISVLYNIILITNFKLIEMCIKSSSYREGVPNGQGILSSHSPYLIEYSTIKKKGEWGA